MFRTLAFAAETFLFAYIGLSAVIFNYGNVRIIIYYIALYEITLYYPVM